VTSQPSRSRSSIANISRNIFLVFESISQCFGSRFDKFPLLFISCLIGQYRSNSETPIFVQVTTSRQYLTFRFLIQPSVPDLRIISFIKSFKGLCWPYRQSYCFSIVFIALVQRNGTLSGIFHATESFNFSFSFRFCGRAGLRLHYSPADFVFFATFSRDSDHFYDPATRTTL